MDLIVTDAGHIDRAVIEDYALDAAWGADENDFELTVDRMLEPGSYVYADGSELGGVIDSLRDRLERGGSTLTYGGRTWHGILANKILAPDTGQNYLVVSGKASTVIGMIVNRVGLAPLFQAVAPPPGIGDPDIKTYQVARYTDCYAGLRAMCAANGLKLRLAYRSGHVEIWAEPAAHYGDSIDSDLIDFDATRTWLRVNHLIGLGKGELANRTVVHWYADKDGNVSQNQSLHGTEEIAQTYDYSNAESDELDAKTRDKLIGMQSQGDVKVTVRDGTEIEMDVGDTVAARAQITGITVQATVTKKITKTKNGSTSIDYEAS